MMENKRNPIRRYTAEDMLDKVAVDCDEIRDKIKRKATFQAAERILERTNGWINKMFPRGGTEAPRRAIEEIKERLKVEVDAKPKEAEKTARCFDGDKRWHRRVIDFISEAGEYIEIATTLIAKADSKACYVPERHIIDYLKAAENRIDLCCELFERQRQQDDESEEETE